jgi:SlyX protein
MNAEALERIETKIAFLERANAELSDVVFRQHQEIGALRAQLLALSERVGSMRSEEGARAPEDERPPHY